MTTVDYETVLVSTDGSEAATAALEHGIGVAKRHDATLHAVFVVDAATLAGDLDGTAIYDALENVGRGVLEDVTALAETEGVPVETALLAGRPHREILDYADECGADLIVMGTHGRTGLDRYLLGSVTEKVVRLSQRPVLTVHAASDPGADDGSKSDEE